MMFCSLKFTIVVRTLLCNEGLEYAMYVGTYLSS